MNAHQAVALKQRCVKCGFWHDLTTAVVVGARGSVVEDRPNATGYEIGSSEPSPAPVSRAPSSIFVCRVSSPPPEAR